MTLKQSVRIFTPDIQLLCEIDDYEYLQLTHKYYGVGSFEMRININKNYVETLEKNNLIMIGNKSDNVGIILYKEIGLSDSGKQSEQWIIKGCTLEGICARRITMPPLEQAYDTVKGTGEQVIKHYINSNMVEPKDISRKIDILTIGEIQGLGNILSYQSRFKNLAEELEKIALLTELGWKVSLDTKNKKYVFDCYKGTDRTTNQDTVPPVIFSTNFDTLKNATYIDSNINYKNTVYVGGQGEGVDRTVLEIGENTGLDRYEIFADARDTDDTEILTNRGNEVLLENSNVISFEGSIMNNNVYEYKKDWFLGDVVTVLHKEWGVQLHTRIVEVTEVFQASGYSLETVFGSNAPTLTSRIKQELKQISGEIYK